jgi:ATP-dependent Clp protease protease subunit
MYRSKNLSGLVENDQGHIVVDAPYQDVIIEIFTQDALECGELTIVVSLLTAETTVHQEISIQVVPEEEMDTAEINEHVVERVKALSNTSPTNDDDEDNSNIVYIQPKILEQRISHLEKNYRIDYGY